MRKEKTDSRVADPFGAMRLSGGLDGRDLTCLGEGKGIDHRGEMNQARI